METESSLVVIGIPISKRPLNARERISLCQLNNVLEKYPKIFIAPKDFEFDYGVEYKSYGIERFTDEYFGSTEAHNNLLLSKNFYVRFIKYKFLLIYHLDAFVFRDNLKKFCDMDYDYIGAPVFEKRIGTVNLQNCMNGGFSLRKIKSMIRVLENTKEIREKWITNEDIFFSWYGEIKNHLNLAPYEVAKTFSFEARGRYLYRKNHNTLPFGCHAWEKYDYKFYKRFIEQYGFDLSNINYDGDLDIVYRKKRLIEYLFQRILRKSENQQYVKIYLENLFGINQNYAIFGCGQDGQKFCGKLKMISINIICFFDNVPRKWEKKVCDILIKDPDKEYILNNNVKILVATKTYAQQIISQLENMGLVNRKHFIDAIVLQKMLVEDYYKLNFPSTN